MSILVSCQCGKRFKTGDQYAGKRAKCPGCGQPLIVPATSAPLAAKTPSPARPRPVPATQDDDLLSLAEPEVFTPAAHSQAATTTAIKASKISAAAGIPPQSKRDRDTGKAGVPRVTVSPAIIALIVLAILIPSAIFWAKEGPMKTEAEWTKMSPAASENIGGQISRAIQQRYKEMGRDMLDMKFLPKADEPFFDSLGFMIKMPETVSFQGTSTEGHYSGKFHPLTWRFEADVPLRLSPKLLTITGSASESDRSLDIDGKSIKG